MLARLPLKTAEPRGTLWPVDRNRSDRRSETVAQHQQPAGERAYRSVEFDRLCLVVASTRFGLQARSNADSAWCLRVVAADLGVTERGTLLGPAVHGHDRRVHIDGQRPGKVARSCPRGPQPGQELTGDRVEQTDVGPLVGPQPRPHRRGCPCAVEHRPGRPRVVDAVTAGEHRTDHRQRFRAAVRPMAAQAKPPVDDPTKVHPLRQHRRRQQAAFGTRFRSSKVVETRDRSWLARTQL